MRSTTTLFVWRFSSQFVVFPLFFLSFQHQFTTLSSILRGFEKCFVVPGVGLEIINRAKIAVLPFFHFSNNNFMTSAD